MTAKVLAFGSIIFLSACALERNAINLGSNDAGGDGTPTGPGGPNDSPECLRKPQLPVVGNWVGYIENFRSPSGSDALTLAISSASASVACGTVTIGAGPPPAPPTDPEIGYPPNYPKDEWQYSDSFALVEGFPLTLSEAVATGERLVFRAQSREIWSAWCALQTPYPDPGDQAVYRCVKAGDGGGIGNGGSPGVCTFAGASVDCGKLALCGPFGNVCTCTVHDCRADLIPDLFFDLRFEASKAAGSVRLPSNQVHNVFLSSTK